MALFFEKSKELKKKCPVPLMTQTLQRFPLLQIKAQALKMFAQGGAHARYNTGFSCIAKLLSNFIHLYSTQVKLRAPLQNTY